MNREIAIANLLAFRKALAGRRWWLEAGTCLGAFREGKLIAHDQDTDVGVLTEDFDWSVVNDLLAEGFTLVQVFGSRHRGLELAFRREGVKTDLFVFYPKDGRRWHAAYRNGHRSGTDADMIVLAFDAGLVEETAAATLEGHDFPVPKRTEEYLLARYGEGWRAPDPHWDWARDPKCIDQNLNV